LSITLGLLAGVCCKSKVSYVRDYSLLISAPYPDITYSVTVVVGTVIDVLVIFLTSIAKAPPAPPATGIHDIDCRSLDMVRVPSFFLYAADPLGGVGAIVVESPHDSGG